MADGVGAAGGGVGAGAGRSVDGGGEEDVAAEGQAEALSWVRQGEAEEAAVVGERLLVLQRDDDGVLGVGESSCAVGCGGGYWREVGGSGRLVKIADL